MNIDIAKNRINAVLKPDSITTSNDDFLLTHVKLEKLNHSKKFNLDPQLDNVCDEEYLYENIIRNPNNIHKFIVVYGQSGTGKSHLIRWFYAKLRNDTDDDEVVLFISRSDNTLKGTIKQLVDIPEIRENIDNETYKRLMDSSSNVDADKLKSLLYYQLIAEIENDDEEYVELFSRPDYKRIPIFLKDEVIQKTMLNDEGPINRIYSKIEESNERVDRDVIAEFIEDDFEFSEELFDEMEQFGSAKKACDIFNYLSENEEDITFKYKLTQYLNTFIGSIIRTSVGIQSNDFQDMFLEIRAELAKQGKNLTLLIEDITSFTGVDDALLNALMTEHTGAYENRNLCRVTSVVGTTIGYFDKYFRDNHRERVTDYIFIPDDVFSHSQIYEFVSKYLNAMSLNSDSIREWVNNGASLNEFPNHKVIEGIEWEQIRISDDLSLPLYPFTKNSIVNLYNSRLTDKNKTPRFIIRDIIEPVIREFIYAREIFPSSKFDNRSYDYSLKQVIEQRIGDKKLVDRLYTFMSVWGDGSYERISIDGELYLSNIKESIYIELNLPILETTVTRQEKKDEYVVLPEKELDNETQLKSTNNQSSISLESQKQLKEIEDILTDWNNQGTINLVSTAGNIGKIKNVLYDLFIYITDAIDWQVEGIPLEYINNRIKVHGKQIIKLEGQNNSDGHYILPNNSETVYVLLAMLRYNTLCKKSRRYDKSDYDIYLLNLFVEKNKANFIKYVKMCKGSIPSTYIDAAMALNIYYMILSGQYYSKSISDISENIFLKNPYLKNMENNNKHTSKWNNVLKRFDNYEDMEIDDSINNKNGIVLNYFNIRQGTKTTDKLVLDRVSIRSKVKEIKKKRFEYDDINLQTDDIFKKRREIVEKYINIKKDLPEVAKAEKSTALEIFNKASIYFGDKKIEKKDIDDMWDLFKKFMVSAAAGNHLVNYSLPDYKSISISNTIDAYNRIREVQDIDDYLDILLYFSTDPIKEVTILANIIENVLKQVKKVENDINKMVVDNMLVNDDSLESKISYELAKTKQLLEGGE